MIVSFKCKETEKIFHGKFSRKLPQNIQRIAARKLEQLNAATVLDTLRVPPGNRLEALSYDKKDNIAFGLTNNGDCVSFGVTVMLMT